MQVRTVRIILNTNRIADPRSSSDMDDGKISYTLKRVNLFIRVLDKIMINFLMTLTIKKLRFSVIVWGGMAKSKGENQESGN